MKRLILATALLALAACAGDPMPAPPASNITDQSCVRTADNDCVERWDDGRPK